MTPPAQCPDHVMSRVLVVDDEAELCQMLAIGLDKTRFQINFAENAAVAYSLLVQEPYDAIVTDVMMPGEDGISFLGRVHQAWPDIPVILMTGYAHTQMAADAVKNGAYDFVHKPFDLDHMRKIVEQAVNYSKLQLGDKTGKADYNT